MACRHDWHQTASSVVVTVYAKTAKPELCCVEANGTVVRRAASSNGFNKRSHTPTARLSPTAVSLQLSCQVHFEDNKVFQRSFHLWGVSVSCRLLQLPAPPHRTRLWLQVIDASCSSVNLVPSKMEIVLRKAHPVSWGKLEDPNRRAEPEDPLEETAESYWDIADDDISDSDEEWAYDTPGNQRQKSSQAAKAEEMQNLRMKDVEDEMKRAAQERQRVEDEKEALRRQEEAEGYDAMPDLE